MIFLRVVLLISMGVPLAFLAGCGTATTGAGAAEGTSVSTRIEFDSRYDIDRAVVTVFQSEGFQLASRRADGFTFQQVGTPATQAVYGDWFAAGVLVRTEVIITNPEFGTHLVRCEVFLLERGAGEWIPAREGNAQFKGLLKKVKKLAGVL